jgi:hypothetical protein
LTFQVVRALRDLEVTANRLDPKLRPLFQEQVSKLREFVDGGVRYLALASWNWRSSPKASSAWRITKGYLRS